MSAHPIAPSGRKLRWIFKSAVLGAVALLAGCINAPNYPQTYQNPNPFFGQQQQQLPAQPTGRTIGTGSVRVGLLLPYSGEGQVATPVAKLFEQSAKMALEDFQGADIQLLVKDTGGTFEGGQMAAQAAISEGAELIIGPVFAQAVQGATAVARNNRVPVVAFSSDTTAARAGTYLLSYLPESDVNRIVSYAVEQERRSFGALLPNDSYGAVVEAAFRQAVGRTNARIVTIERYTPGDVQDIRAKITNLGRSVGQIDTLFVPQGGAIPPFVMQVMTENGASIGQLKLIGSGQWNSPDIKRSPVLVGSWFPGPDNGSFERFAQRYAEIYGARPARNASLAYDATILAAGLVRSAGPQRFTDRVMTSKDGFLGIDGVFRFEPNGLNERGLAVYAVTGKPEAQAVAPAPRSFGEVF